MDTTVPNTGESFDQPQAEQFIDESQQSVAPQPEYFGQPMNQPEPEYLLLQWEAFSRIAIKRSRDYYSSLLVIVLLVSLILFFMNQTLLIFTIWSILFLNYVLSSVKPELVVNQITTYGIRYRGRLFYWQQLGRFWTRESHGIVQVMIEAPGNTLSSHMILLPEAPLGTPDAVTAQEIVDVLSRYLIFEEPLPSQVDRWVQWVEDKFPLEPPTTSSK